MTTLTQPGPPGSPSLLDRAATIAQPGFNRWLVPPAALAIHLCIGMAYGFSVFWLPFKAIGIRNPIACPKDLACSADFQRQLRLENLDLGWMLRCFSSFSARRRHLGRLAGTCRPAPRRRRCRICWSGGLVILRSRRYPIKSGSCGSVRRNRRHRLGPGLYLAGVDPDQMVPGQARHGDRNGHHGLRRRRNDRRAVGGC